MARLPARFLAPLAAVLLVGGCDDSDPAGPEPPTVITAGVAVTGLAGSPNSQRVFRVTGPAGTQRLTVTTSSGAGDVDVYVRRGDSPTENFSHCISEREATVETCAIPAPVAGDWFILLRGFQGVGYSGVTLLATTSTTPLTATLLTSGTAVTAIAGDEDSETLFRIVVPAGRTRLLVTTTGGTGDVDLFISSSVAGGTECASLTEENSETCDITNPVAGDWFIQLLGFEAYTGVTLTATYTPG